MPTYIPEENRGFFISSTHAAKIVGCSITYLPKVMFRYGYQPIDKVGNTVIWGRDDVEEAAKKYAARPTRYHRRGHPRED